jgi:hypothetical protein
MDLSQVGDIIKYTLFEDYIDDLKYQNYIEISKQDNVVVYENMVRAHYAGERDIIFTVTTKNDKITSIHISNKFSYFCAILDNGLIEITSSYVIKYVCVGVYTYLDYNNTYNVNNTFETKQYSEVVRYVRKMMPNILLEPLMQIVLDYFIVKAI